MNERERNYTVNSGTILALTLLLLFLTSPTSSTSVTSTDVPVDTFRTVVGTTGVGEVLAMKFTIRDGGDTDLLNSTSPGTTLYSFQNNRTMFLNQTTGATGGINGYNSGEDIFRVKIVNTGLSNQTINGSELRSFSSKTMYADTDTSGNDVFNGDEGTGKTAEAIVRDNGSVKNALDERDFVVSSGEMNISDFSGDIRYVNVNSSSYVFEGGPEAIVDNTVDDTGILEESDRILREGGALLTAFAQNVSFADNDGDQNYSAGNAIVRELGDDDYVFEPSDKVVTNGTASIVLAQNTQLRYYESMDSLTSGFDDVAEPIYYQDNVRIGYVEVSSKNDSDYGNIDLGLPTMALINSTKNGTLDNDVGKPLYPAKNTYTDYGEDSNFRVYEYATAGSAPDNIWNPNEVNGDQDVLVYDMKDGSSISPGDVLIYNENSSKGNVTINVGEEFNSTSAPASSATDSYQPAVAEVGFMDNGSNKYEPGADNISVNISNGGNWAVVNLAPSSAVPNLATSGSLNTTRGQIKFWNASDNLENTRDDDSGDPVSDGLYVDVDNSGNVTHGDARIGEWVVEEPPGEVSSGDLDLNVSFDSFSSSDGVAILDEDGSGGYSPGSSSNTGKVSDNDGREAVIKSDNQILETTDSVIRSGDAAFFDFNNGNFPKKVRFTDGNLNGVYDDGEAVVRNNGSQRKVLEQEDNVIVPGEAALRQFSNNERYVETGKSPGFEMKSNETIIYDVGADGIMTRGNLSSGDRVIVKGNASLQNFSMPPSSANSSYSNNTGLVYMEENRTDIYEGGEDILELTWLLNGSAGTEINGTEIYNFANTTRHTGSQTYNSGDAIINDTDGNRVYQDVFNGIGIRNIFSPQESFEEKLTASDIEESTLGLYTESSGTGFDVTEDREIASLSSTSEPDEWNTTSFKENITSDQTFYVTFDPLSSLDDKAYIMQAETVNFGLDSGRSVYSKNGKIQVVDSHAPDMKSAITGNVSTGNSEARDKIYVVVAEKYAGISSPISNSIFNITNSGIKVSSVVKRNNNNLELRLNDSLPTNSTPEVKLNDSNSNFQDLKGNIRYSDSTEATDGLRPLIQDVKYEDSDVDGMIDGLDVEFSENVSYSDFHVSGWNFFNKGIPCLHALAPGDSMSFCSTQPRMMHVTSGDYSTIYNTARYLTEPLHLNSGSKVDSSNSNSSKYEIGRDLYDVNSSLTGYGGNGTFMVYEFDTSDSPADGVWNPNETSGEQDVLVYDKNGDGNLSVGDILIYDENSSNNNITDLKAGQHFNKTSLQTSENSSNSYKVDADIGFTGNSTYESADNVTVKITYKSSSYSTPNSTFVSMAPGSITPGLGKTGTFHSQGEMKFFNTTPSSSNLLEDGLFIDMDENGNITGGDVRLGGWTMRNKKKLYLHRLKLPVTSQAGEELNRTVVEFDSEKLGYMNTNAVKEAYIQNSTEKKNVKQNITEVQKDKNGKLLNVSFDTGNRNVWLNKSETVVLKYYSEYKADVTEVEGAAINPKPSGNYTYYGNGTLGQSNTPVVSINASAAEGVTGVPNASSEPLLNFSVFDNVVTDLSGNTLTNASKITLSDGAAPAVTGAATHDEDNDAEIDKISVNFSENLVDSASSYSSAFNLSNGSILGVENTVSNNSELALNVSGVGSTGFVPDLKMYNNTVFDHSGNSANIIQSFNSVEDLANPVLLNSELDPVKSSSDYSFIQMRFSENVTGTPGESEEITVQNQSGYIRNGVFQMNQENDTHSINYTKILQTGRVPNITAAENIVDDNRNPVVLENSEKVAVNTFRREIVEGWNFVSFPIADQSNPGIEKTIDTSDVAVIWTKENGSWSSYDPEAPDEVNEFSRFRGGEGYILKAEGNFTMTPNVNNEWVSGGLGVGQANATLNPGSYTLAGQFQEYRQDADTEAAFAAIAEGSVGRIYRQKSLGSLELEEIKSMTSENTTEEMMPGHAYRVYIKNSGVDSWTWSKPKR